MQGEAPDSFNGSNVLNEHAAARHLGVSVSTLRRRRADRRAPAFIRLDRRIGYRRDVLDRFLDENTVAPCEAESDVPQVQPVPRPRREVQ